MAGNGDGANGSDGGESESSRVANLAEHRSRSRVRPVDGTVAVRLAKARSVLPRHCPYEPIGHDGERYFVIDAQHSLRAHKPRELARNVMSSICDGRAWLCEHYPRTRQGKPVDGMRTEDAADDLMRACHLMGYWTADDMVRGRGAWLGEDGDLILHRGNHLVINGRVQSIGRHGEYVYLQRPALPAMATDKQGDGPHSAANELLARFDTFPWSRGTLDSQLMLGFTGAAMVGGALPFRPHAFVTGEFQAGKSTLQITLQSLFGHGGIVSVSDTSAAGIWQAFQCDTLPAGVDELEAEADLRRAGDIVRLVRQASSGGMVLRGGADHRGASFLIRSCFFCSAIIPPPMPSQDASRFVRFDLVQIPHGTVLKPFSTDRLEVIGRGILRRMADHWRRLTGEVLPAFRERMVEKFHFPRRTADLYAVLFACADVLLYDQMSLARLDARCDHRFMVDVLAEVMADHTPEWQRCFAYLLSSRIDQRRADAQAIGELLAIVVTGMRRNVTGRWQQAAMFAEAADSDVIPGDDDGKIQAAHDRLRGIGLRVVARGSPDHGEPPELFLMVANQHNGLAEIMRDTPWQTVANASGGGGWSQALRRKPGAKPSPDVVRFRQGVRSRALMLPLDDVFHDDARPEAPHNGQDAARAAPLH